MAVDIVFVALGAIYLIANSKQKNDSMQVSLLCS